MARRYCSILLTCLLACSLPMLGCNDGSVTLNDQDNSQKDKNKDKNKDKDKNKTGDEGNTGDDGKNKPGDDDEDNTGDDDKNKPGDDDKNKPGDEDKQKTCIEPDEDGDTISDEHEGRAEERDTDGDGTPDYKDEDSDGDTIPDKVEARNGECSGETPEDMDNDGLPNYLDDDSDDNGIPDSAEAGADPTNPVDTDGDGTPDFVSDDNDGDGTSDQDEILGLIKIGGEEMTEENFSGDCDGDTLPDARGTLENPVDCDKDGVYDYLDKDSDGDTLPDSVEKDIIIGKYYARYSKDADGNGISDYAECAGKMTDAEVTELPETCVDTDGDGTPDFLDVDNDGDGLSDTFELGISADPFKDDSDGDGANDLIEYGAGSSLTDPADNPQSKGNFVFVVPYKKPSSPDKGSLSFSTSVQAVDLYFAIDTSGSTYDEIDALSQNIKPLMDSLKCKVLDGSFTCNEDKDCADHGIVDSICSVISHQCVEDPTKKAGGCVSDMWVGTGSWGDCGQFGHIMDVNSNVDSFISRLGSLPHRGITENVWDAIYCGIASPSESNLCSGRATNCAAGKDTCVGFRDNSLRVFIPLTDEAQMNASNCQSVSRGSSYNVTCFGMSDLDTTLATNVGKYARSKNVNIVGFWGGSAECILKSAIEGNGLDSSVFNIRCDGSGIVNATKQAIISISQNKPLVITTEASDIDEGAAALIDGLSVNITDAAVEGKTCTKVDSIVPGKFEGISALLPGRAVCYDVKPVAVNEVIPAQDVPLVKKAKIAIKGDGSTLSERVVYFLIPPVFEEESGIN